jgi:4-amino-4-deoxy-L-arabinose transferase-like glycosyltransferase
MVAVLAIYCALHFAVRFCLSPTLGWDDAEQALWAQQLSLGYEIRQPPLYTWMLWGLFQVFGKTVFATAVLRYIILFFTFLSLYASACLIFKDKRKIALVTFSYWLIYVFMFYAHHDLTHTTLLAFAVAFTFLVMLLIHRRPSLPLYALLGCTLALGFYAKYNYVVFPIAMMMAALTLKAFRPLVLNRGTLVSIALAGLAVSPYVAWVFSQDHSFVETGRTILRGEQGGLLLIHARGLGAVAVAVVEFTLPFGIVALVLFPELFRWRPGPKDVQLYRTLLGCSMLYGLGIICCIVIALDATQFKGRWMLPLLMHGPFLLFTGKFQNNLSPVRYRIYLGLVGAFVLTAVVARFATDYWEPRTSGKCRRTLPVAAIQEPLTALGVAEDVILAESNHMAGNLVVLFPNATVVRAKPEDLFSTLSRPGKRLFIWKGDAENRGPLSNKHSQRLSGLPVEELIPNGRIVAPFEQYPERTVQFCYLSLPARTASKNQIGEHRRR